MSRTLSLCLVAWLVTACGPQARPTVIAHRAGGGYWPENSRTAVQRSIQRRYPGLEFDVTLTKDLVPVLAHDPWLSEKHCTRVDGSPLPGRVLIQDFTLAELQERYRCGGVEDPDSPGVERVADTLMTFDEVLQALTATPEMLVHVDLKCEPGLTPSAEDFAEQILGRWRAHALPNPMYVDSGLPEVLAAFHARGPVTSTLSWPWFPAGSTGPAQVLPKEFLSRLGLDDMVAAAKRAGASGVCLPYALADKHAVQQARREGLNVQLFSPNTRATLRYFCDWPVDVLISDYPEEAPCLR